jgi:prepilin-type N-terminal cleavage/methylation domain-containing protein
MTKSKVIQKGACAQHETGFTLIELMVVVAVIVVLAGVLLLSINPASLKAKGDDARRLSDLGTLNKAIQYALAEDEFILTATYSCATCNSVSGTQAVDGTGYVPYTLPNGKTGLSRYIPALPVDPVNSGVNIYTYGATTSYYELNAVLVHADNITKMTTDGGDDPAVYEVGTSLTIL